MANPVELEHSLTIDGAPFDLLALSAREALDEIGILRCEITDHAGGPDPATLVGKPLLLTLSRRGGDEERTFAGYVVEAESTTTRGTEEAGTRLVARHRLFRLTQRADCRTFQDMSAPDIVKEVLTGAGLSAKEQRWKLGGSYPKRVYTAQYRETDHDFMRRILSEEGIAFFVDSSSGTDVVVFFDGDPEAVEGKPEIVFRPAEGLAATDDAITTLSHEKSTAPGRVHLRDYDFERPRLKLDGKAEGDDDTEKALEVYAYPGRFTEPSVGDRYAKVLLESLRARREVVTGTTNALRVLPGRTFELSEHPYEPLNQEYLVVELDIELEARRGTNRRGEGQGERFTFRAIPTKKTRYRPPRVSRAASVAGAQVAVTTGPPGKEIHPDKHGRVKVLFPWDRRGKADDSSSLWIRTTQVPLGGGMLTPRVGWEVCVACVDGDPDQPFIGGRLYNTITPPPYALPANKTRMALQTATTPGGGSSNEIRMDDRAGNEEMFMNASRDGSVSAGNNATESVGNNETRSIGSNHSLAVTDSMSAHIGANQDLSVGGNQTVHVSTYMVDEVGSHALTVGGNRDLKAGGDHKRTVAGASTSSIGGMQVDLVAGSVDEETMATMQDKVGAVLVEMTASDRTVTVKGSRTETAGLAKVVLASGGRAVEVGAGLSQKVIGAIVNKVSGDREDQSKGDFLEVAGGAQIIKATNVTFEAKNVLSVVMGASTLTLTPASVSIAGTKITLDGDCDELGLIKDN
ncbi:type VI secretion system tip protein TssI/VgrG [Polyangium sp. 15x6]|uniref:type VI secretion system Vgr family protein n=1 Tax=Polyangium sp. 15x6 TaxID=3042687 RepID=UPI00249A8FF9|nr:type VI secretion system tip protein TssI/VgrG [Polyangium sp. 15x6]MDI3284255.1 type VI secretion system tip protein TssI/VgrG [Polyangium sp. 15x6]